MSEVRALEWQQFESSWTARTPFDRFCYGVLPWYELSGDWSVRLNGKEFARTKDEQSAKAAAQSDYERRVRAALA